MAKIIDLRGRTFGKLYVIKRVWNDAGYRAQWWCECQCGEFPVMHSYALLHGISESCGCHMRAVAITHGKYKHPLYNVYKNMKDRCYNNKNTAFRYYGGKGVTVCEEWLGEFRVFFDWAKNNGYKKGLEIDRMDNDGNYEPRNCRLTTRVVNMRNAGNAKRWVVKGETYLSLSDAANKTGVCATTIKLWCDGGINNGKKVIPMPGCWSYGRYPGATV